MANNTYTDGTVSGTWSPGGNWSDGSKPDATDTAYVDGTTDNNLTADENIDCLGAEFTADYDGDFDAGDSKSHAYGSAGLILAHKGGADMGAGTTHTITAGLFNYADCTSHIRATSTVVLGGVCTIKGLNGRYLQHLTVSAGATVTGGAGTQGVLSQGVVTIDGSWDLTGQWTRIAWAGTLALGGSATIASDVLIYNSSAGAGITSNAGATFTGAISWFMGNAASVFAAGTYASLRLYGAGFCPLSAGACAFTNVDFNPTTATDFTLDLSASPSVTITGDWRINVDGTGDAVVVASSNPITLQGDLLDQRTGGGAFAAGGQDLLLDDVANVSIAFCGGTFGDVEIDKVAGTVTVADNWAAASLTLTDGDIDFNAKTVTFSGVVSFASGSTVADPAGSTINCGTFAADGQAGLEASNAWFLNAATSATISNATVAYLDASGGVEVDATDNCVEGPGCVNVDFGAVALGPWEVGAWNTPCEAGAWR